MTTGEAVADPEHAVQAGGRGQAEAMSRGPMRVAACWPAGRRARAPEASPVRSSAARTASRGPRNVNANAALAASPSAGRQGRPRGVTPGRAVALGPVRDATRQRQHEAEHEQDAERAVQLRRLQVDHGDGPLLAGRAKLGRPDELRRAAAATAWPAASHGGSSPPRRPAPRAMYAPTTSADVAECACAAPTAQRASTIRPARRR